MRRSDVAVIGAKWDDDNGNASGSAFVFTWNGAAWSSPTSTFAATSSGAPPVGASKDRVSMPLRPRHAASVVPSARRTALTRLPHPAYTVRQFSSYDRKSQHPDVLTDEDLELYDIAADRSLEPEARRWMEQGTLGSADAGSDLRR